MEGKATTVMPASAVKPRIMIAMPQEGSASFEFFERTWFALKVEPMPWCDRHFMMCRVPSLPLARNILIREFLKSPCTHIFWLDSDVILETPSTWNEALLSMYRVLEETGESIVSGLYRAKQAHGFNYAAWKWAPPDSIQSGFIHVNGWSGNWFEVEVCLPPKSEIYTPNGTVYIENIKNGDTILGEYGYQTVLKTHSREYIDDLINIKVRYLKDVSFTKEHPILIRRAHLEKRGMVLDSTNEWMSAGDLYDADLGDRKGKKLFCVIPKEKTETPYDTLVTDKVLEITPSLAKMLGLWFAEGSVYKAGDGKYHRYQFAFNSNENDLVDYVVKELRELDLNPFFNYYPERSCAVVYGNSKEFYHFLMENFGHGAKGKRIPEWLFNERKEIISAFIEGLVLGDGCTCRDKRSEHCTYTSIKLANREAVLQLQRLLRKIGIVASYMDVEGKSFFNGKFFISKQASVRWALTIKNRFYKEDEDYYYLPITEITKVPYNGLVYNITTTEKQFLVPFITHNCGAGCLMMKRRVLESLNEQKNYAQRKLDEIKTKFATDISGVSHLINAEEIVHWETPDTMSEDFNMLQKARKLGYKTWVLADIKLSHEGRVVINTSGSIRVPAA